MVVNCELVWREISNYVEGEVDPALRTAMEEHFHVCEKCSSVLAGMRNVIAVYGDERMLEVPAGFSRRLEKKLAQSARGERRWSTWSAWLVPAAALALMVGGLRVANSLAPNPPSKSELAQLGRDIPPDLVVVAASGTRLFHLPGCGVIHDKDQLKTMTAKEAIREGYAPCTRCLRKYLDVAELHRLEIETDTNASEGLDVEEARLPGAGQ